MRTDAIIISREPIREKDLLVRCFTEQAGLISAIARGAMNEHSIQGMHLDQGNLVSFDLVAAHGMPLITGTVSLRAHCAVKRDLRRQAAVWTLLEAVQVLVAGTEPDAALWEHLCGTMARIEACAPEQLLPTVRNGQLALLGILGYAPRVNECGICGAAPEGTHAFSVQLGSLVCARCISRGWRGMPLGEQDRRWLAGGTEVAPGVHMRTRAATERLIEYVAGRPLRSLDLLFSVLQA